MFSYQSVYGTNIVSLEDSEKNGNFWKMTFYPKMMFIRISEIFHFSQNNDLPQTQSCTFHFLRGKNTQIWPGKDVNPLRGLDDSP